MKKHLFYLIILSSFSFFSFTSNSSLIQEKPQIGDVLVISKNTSNNYKHIKFPKRNILHKRGAMANYNKVYGAEVVITEVKENKHGRIDVKLVRTDGKKFFNKIKSVTAIYHKAIESGELKNKS